MVVAGDIAPGTGAEKFGLDKGPDELFKGHSVIAEESGHGYRCCQKQAEPACGFFSYDLMQSEINTGGDANGQSGADKLPGGQTEENGFLVLADFFWNFDFDGDSPLFMKNNFCETNFSVSTVADAADARLL